MLDVFRAGEEGSISGGAVGASEEGVARGSAGGRLHVVAGEGAAIAGEGIDVRRLDVVFSKGAELGPEVINADEENVGLGGLCGEEGGVEEEEETVEHEGLGLGS